MDDPSPGPQSCTVGIDDSATFRAAAFRSYARDFLRAYSSLEGGRGFSPVRYFLICRAIELAAKAMHIGRDPSGRSVKQIGHFLEKACEPSVLAGCGVELDTDELAELSKADAYYKDRGFKYFLFDNKVDESGPEKILKGWPGLPSLGALEGILAKPLAPPL